METLKKMLSIIKGSYVKTLTTESYYNKIAPYQNICSMTHGMRP